MKPTFYRILEDCPVIAAVKDDQALEASLRSPCQIIFVLYGDICNVGQIVSRIKEEGRVAMVHPDLITGLDGREIAVDYIKERTGADGIISTKTTQIRYAKEKGLYAIHRFFALDSRSLENIYKQSMAGGPDCIEILPGLMPRVIERAVKVQKLSVIAGGMIESKEDVMMALKAGAAAVSTTRQELWFV